MTSEKFDLVVLEQGISLNDLSVTELIDWIENERAFLQTLNRLVSQNLIINNTNYGGGRVKGEVDQELVSLLQALKSDGEKSKVAGSLENYLSPARNFRRILSDSPLGRELTRLATLTETDALPFPILLNSDDFITNNSNATKLIERERLVRLSHSFPATVDSFAAKTARELSERSLELTKKELDSLRELTQAQQKSLSDLHDTYHKKLALDASATEWSTEFNSRTSQWKFWLGAFSLLLLLPIGLLIIYHSSISIFIKEMATNDGTFHLGGVAILTAPLLLYAWFLRQLSKLFIRAFDLAVDATHRRTLTKTFLGLAANEKVGVSGAERAIILQALFRPQPPHMSDDGPPLGLVELLNSKKD